MKNKLIVLLVEDNEPDVLLTSEMLQQTGIDFSIHTVKDGVKAIDFILQQNGYQDAPAPDLIVLDINLPKKDGKQVLNYIKSSALNTVPVIIYTSSTLQTDIAECKKAGADLYLNKPVLINELDEISDQVKQFILNNLK
jgi:two-component system, chemotaxis family, response regulator Rcp1